MKVLVTGRGEGKTTRLMEIALDFGQRFPTCIVVVDQKEEDRVNHLYRAQLINSKVEVIHFRRLLANPKKRFKRMLVDNVELMLAMILGGNVDPNEGRLTTLSMTGLPMADVEAARAGAVLLWRKAAAMALEHGSPAITEPLALKYTAMADELYATLPDLWKQRIAPETQPLPDNVTKIN